MHILFQWVLNRIKVKKSLDNASCFSRRFRALFAELLFVFLFLLRCGNGCQVVDYLLQNVLAFTRRQVAEEILRCQLHKPGEERTSRSSLEGRASSGSASRPRGGPEVHQRPTWGLFSKAHLGRLCRERSGSEQQSSWPLWLWGRVLNLLELPPPSPLQKTLNYMSEESSDADFIKRSCSQGQAKKACFGFTKCLGNGCP